MQTPKLEKQPKTHKFHNYVVEDDFNYLEANWQEIVKNPKLLPKKIANYIADENKYADEYLHDTKEIQDILWKTHRGRIKEDETQLKLNIKTTFIIYAIVKKTKTKVITR